MIYLVRHGKTEWNSKGWVQGIQDSPLTVEGILTSKRVGLILRELVSEDYVMFCSTLRRAEHSAELISDSYTPNGVIYSPMLVERNLGRWEGKPLIEDTDEFRLYSKDKYNYKDHGGESYKEVEQRLRKFVSFISGFESDIVIVAHQTVNYVLSSIFTNKEYNKGIKGDHTEILEIDKSKNEPTIRKINIWSEKEFA